MCRSPASLTKVADEIVWAQAEVPAKGHYCFVAIASTADDPAPPLGNLVNLDNFVAFSRNNNAMWRNFNVIPSTGPSADPVVMPFLAVGAFDRGLRMGLEVIARPPEGAKLALEAPDFFIDRIEKQHHERTRDDLVRIPLRPTGRQVLGVFTFPRVSSSAYDLSRISPTKPASGPDTRSPCASTS